MRLRIARKHIRLQKQTDDKKFIHTQSQNEIAYKVKVGYHVIFSHNLILLRIYIFCILYQGWCIAKTPAHHTTSTMTRLS